MADVKTILAEFFAPRRFLSPTGILRGWTFRRAQLALKVLRGNFRLGPEFETKLRVLTFSFESKLEARLFARLQSPK